MSASAPAPSDSQTRIHILNTAMEVFLRYGYKKTSMADVAGEAQLSRQGLYLHFPTKESLFRATVAHTITNAHSGVAVALARKAPLEKRLLEVFEITMGRFVGKLGADAYDLWEASHSLAQDTINESCEKLGKQMVEAIKAETLEDLSTIKGIRAEDRVELLLNAAGGLKHCVQTREEFREGMLSAIRVTLSPLRLRPQG